MDELKNLQSSWLAASASSELKNKPKSFQVLGRNLVLFRSDDAVVALDDRCPHRNVPLSIGSMKNGRIKCSYHGWEFGKNGDCEFIPGLRVGSAAGQSVVPKYATLERNGLIWINLNSGASENELPRELLTDRGITSDFFIVKTDVVGSLLNAVENLLDGFHTPFVHAGLVRSAKNPQQVTARVRPSSGRVEIEYTGENGQSGLISRLLESGRGSSFGRFIYPSIAQLEYCRPEGTALLITAYFSPICTDRQRVYAVVETPQGLLPNFLKRLVLGFFFRRVLDQDRKILEAQTKCIKQFGEEKFTSTRLDLIRPHLVHLLGPNPSGIGSQQERIEEFHL